MHYFKSFPCIVIYVDHVNIALPPDTLVELCEYISGSHRRIASYYFQFLQQLQAAFFLQLERAFYTRHAH